MILNSSNARKFYDEMGHEKFDKVAKMAELIVHNTYYEEVEKPFRYLDVRDAMKYVENFFKSISEDYYYRVCNILKENVRDDSFQSDLAREYSKSETFPENDGLCFIIREVQENEFGEFTGKNKFDAVTGEIVINRENNIKTAFFSVHELAHKLATSNNALDYERYFYSEIPSITFEKLFLDWLTTTGYHYDEIDQLRKERNISSYRYALIVLIADELIKSNKDEIDLDDIMDSLYFRIPNLDTKGLNMDLLGKMYQKGISYSDYSIQLLRNIPYVVGRVMSDYYVADYRKNKSDADIFKFMHLYGDGLLDEETTRYHYMFLNLPFENSNMKELEEYFEGDIIDVEYEDVEDEKNIFNN